MRQAQRESSWEVWGQELRAEQEDWVTLLHVVTPGKTLQWNPCPSPNQMLNNVTV
jgi:hypothetical protein